MYTYIFQSQPTSGTRRPRSVSHHGGPSSRATMGAPGLHGGAPGSHMKTPRSVSSGRSRTPVSAGRSGGGAGAGPLGHRQNPSRLSMAAVGTSGSNGRSVHLQPFFYFLYAQVTDHFECREKLNLTAGFLQRASTVCHMPQICLNFARNFTVQRKYWVY